jgi:hypothetical protein
MKIGKLERREERDMTPTKLDHGNSGVALIRRARLSLIEVIFDDV